MYHLPLIFFFSFRDGDNVSVCLEILVHIWPLCLLVNGWNFNCLAGGMFQLFLMRADLLYLWGPLKAEHGHILADELIYFFFKLSLKPVWFLKFYLLYNSTKLHPAQKNTGYIYPNYEKTTGPKYIAGTI